MSRSTYPLKLPASVKTAAARLAKTDGVSLNQFIAVAVAENVGVMETAADFLKRRAEHAKPRDLLRFTRKAARELPNEADRR
jgi:hypothetical protein